jgi:thymidylate synthase
MKIKNSNLKWYVLRWDSNTKKVVNYNILSDIADDLAREVRSKRVYNKSILREYLKTVFMYSYWSKTECEFFVSDLHGNEYEKIDIWRQIEPNLNNIVEYVNTKMDLKFE